MRRVLRRHYPMPFDDPVPAYAVTAVQQEILVGPIVRQACQRHLDDIEHGSARGLRWSPETAAYGIGFSRFVRHSKGEWRGQVLELDPWQKFIIGSGFGWLRYYADEWRRRFRTIYIEVPKKNGKSTLCAFVGIYGLIGDGEPGAEIYAAASARKQALLVFNDAKEMVRTSPDLRSEIGVLFSNLSHQASYSKFEPISSDENTGDGVNPHFVIVDELHRIKTRGLRTALTQGFGARRQPMEWIITTAGDDRPGTPYDEEHNYAKKVVERVLEDDTYFAYIASPDEDDPWDNETTWAKANPGYGTSVKHEDLAARALKARSAPSELAEFKRFRLNVRTSDMDAEIKSETWKKNSLGPIDEEKLRGRLCHTGIDLSAKTDSTAMVHLFPPLTAGERWTVVPRFWVPAEGVDDRSDRDRAPYRRWIDEGWIQTTPGNRIDYNAVVDRIKTDAELFTIHEVAFDPWNAGSLENDLQEEGFAAVIFPQTMAVFNTPTKEMLALLLDTQIDHGGNPVLAWMASNLAAIKDTKENKMPSKRHSTGRIDGIVALIMALGRALVGEPSSPYSDGRPLLVIG